MRGRCPLVLYIVGDDELEASVHKMLLEHGGYEVLVASGYDPFAVLKESPVDAVILNLTPGGQHPAFVSRMKAIKPHIPVLLVVDGPAAIRLDKYGKADAALLKEDAPGLLLSVLDDLLNVRFPFFTRWFGNWRYRHHAVHAQVLNKLPVMVRDVPHHSGQSRKPVCSPIRPRRWAQEGYRPL